QIKSALIKPTINKESDKWLDNTDVKEMLHISTRTLQRLRVSGMLKYSKIKGKIYYRLTDIYLMLEQNQAE
ncbi:MAG: helix-turn-helix domain-containing protein, partial [Crocinitomicaceae bacterium]|nr:helix-turn-helix domain-containing protein [Crocinitomicaceae bacterium]